MAIGCMITEPYLGRRLAASAWYLQLLERFCRDNDIIFLLDSASQLQPHGSLFAFSEYGVEPDIVVLGKGLGNGIPVSAAVGRTDLFANMHYGEASDTWSEPLASAAVLATLEELPTAAM